LTEHIRKLHLLTQWFH